MKLDEALRVDKIGYKGTRPWYSIHDDNPNVLVLDDDYDVDGKGRSILGFNLNYLDNLKAADRRNLIKRVNKLDNKILDVKGVKAFVKRVFNKGDYKGLSVEKKKERYEELIKKFPELKKTIRRYKYDGVSKRLKK